MKAKCDLLFLIVNDFFMMNQSCLPREYFRAEFARVLLNLLFMYSINVLPEGNRVCALHSASVAINFQTPVVSFGMAAKYIKIAMLKCLCKMPYNYISNTHSFSSHRTGNAILHPLKSHLKGSSLLLCLATCALRVE